MLYFLYLIYGIIGGLASYIFSTSKILLLLFNYIFNTPFLYDKNLLIFINIGIILAMIIIYLKKYICNLKRLLKQKKEKNKKAKANKKNSLKPLIILGFANLISCFILKKATLKLLKPIEISFFFIVSTLIVFLIRNKKGNKEENDIKIKNIVLLIILNVFSNIMGFNNYIITFGVLLLCNFKITVALKYSIIIYLTYLGSFIILNLPNFINSYNSYYFSYYLVAFCSSFFSSLWAFNKFKEKILKKDFLFFIIINFILGILTLIYFR